MPTDENLLSEIKKLNQQLNEISTKNRFMVYSGHPLKFAFYNFLAGIMHSLGSLFGTTVVLAVFVYFFSHIDFVKPMTSWIESVLSQIKWEQIIPAPKIDIPTNPQNL